MEQIHCEERLASIPFCLLCIAFFAFSRFARTIICIIFANIPLHFRTIFHVYVIVFVSTSTCIVRSSSVLCTVMAIKSFLLGAFVATITDCCMQFFLLYFYAWFGFVVRKLHICFFSPTKMLQFYCFICSLWHISFMSSRLNARRTQQMIPNAILANIVVKNWKQREEKKMGRNSSDSFSRSPSWSVCVCVCVLSCRPVEKCLCEYFHCCDWHQIGWQNVYVSTRKWSYLGYYINKQ